jgi:3-isopropylmalate dehydrogenase
MLLEHLGHVDEAKRVEAAVADDLLSRGDVPRSTTHVGDALASALA